MESVRKALMALTLMGERGAMRLADIAEELDVARSTAHRLMVTMREAGFVIQPLGSRLYTLGPAFAGLTSAVVAHDDLIAAARPALAGLRRATEETVHLVTRLGADVYFLDGIEGPRTVRVGLKSGSRLPVIASAAGIAMLSLMTPERIERVIFLSRRVRSFDEGWLSDQVAAAQRAGYAVGLGLAYEDVHEVGVAFRYDPGNHMAALTVAAPASRIDAPRARELGLILRQSANSLAAQLSRLTK